jgi:hypothetical protein
VTSLVSCDQVDTDVNTPSSRFSIPAGELALSWHRVLIGSFETLVSSRLHFLAVHDTQPSRRILDLRPLAYEAPWELGFKEAKGAWHVYQKSAKARRQPRPLDHQGAHTPRSCVIEAPCSVVAMVAARAWRQGFTTHLVHWLKEEIAVMKPGNLDARNIGSQLLKRPTRTTC